MDKETKIEQIVEKLSEGNYRVYGNELRFKCPKSSDPKKHPNADKSPSFFVNLRTGSFNCFGCGFSGGYRKLLRLIGSRYYPEVEELENRMDNLLGRSVSEKEVKKEIELPPNLIDAWITVEKKVKHVSNYLLKRRVSPKLIRELKLRICKDFGLLSNAVIYPINYKEFSFYGARITNEKYSNSTPYFYPKDSPKERVLYGIYKWYKKYDSIILVEGIFDYIRLRMYGYENVVPLFGKYLSEWQVQDLIEFKIRKLYIMLDSDAITEAKRIGSENMRLFDIFICQIQSKDPDDASEKEIEVSIETATPILNLL
jgi:DNA primase